MTELDYSAATTTSETRQVTFTTRFGSFPKIAKFAHGASFPSMIKLVVLLVVLSLAQAVRPVIFTAFLPNNRVMKSQNFMHLVDVPESLLSTSVSSRTWGMKLNGLRNIFHARRNTFEESYGQIEYVVDYPVEQQSVASQQNKFEPDAFIASVVA